MTSLGDMRMDEEVDELMQETNGDGDVPQCTVEQTDGMLNFTFHGTEMCRDMDRVKMLSSHGSANTVSRQ